MWRVYVLCAMKQVGKRTDCTHSDLLKVSSDGKALGLQSFRVEQHRAILKPSGAVCKLYEGVRRITLPHAPIDLETSRLKALASIRAANLHILQLHSLRKGYLQGTATLSHPRYELGADKRCHPRWCLC